MNEWLEIMKKHWKVVKNKDPGRRQAWLWIPGLAVPGRPLEGPFKFSELPFPCLLSRNLDLLHVKGVTRIKQNNVSKSMEHTTYSIKFSPKSTVDKINTFRGKKFIISNKKEKHTIYKEIFCFSSHHFGGGITTLSLCHLHPDLPGPTNATVKLMGLDSAQVLLHFTEHHGEIHPSVI